MSHKITLICDGCGEEFMMDNEMELPPYWMGIQIAIANKDGLLTSEDMFLHICTPECLVEYAQSKEMKEKIILIDQEDISDGETGNNEEEEEDGGI